MMDRRTFLAGAAGGAALALGGCATTAETGPVTGMAEVPVGYRPDIKSDEAGIWMMADRSESQAKTAGNRIREETITGLISDCMCRLAESRCPDVRTYLMRVPVTNAFAMPNGMVQVWSGLLLRMRDESQLAMILGHELVHYRRRHSLQRLRDVRAKADFMAFLGLGLAAAGATPQMMDITQMLTLASISAFSREHEREADAGGFEAAVRAGYAPHAGAQIWKQMMEERKAGGEDEQQYDVFLATHPMDAERQETLEKLAEKYKANKLSAPNRLREALLPVRLELLLDEVRLGHPKRTTWLFDQMLKDDPAPGDILFAKGDLIRRRNGEGDEDLALGFYHQACEAKGAPPEAFRMVGITRWRRGQKDMAREFFRRYLHVAPNAPDRAMITSYLAGA